MASSVNEIVWLCLLLHEVSASQTRPTPLYYDNQVARHIANKPIYHERTKHFEMDCYFVREHIESHEVVTCSISTTEQVVDIYLINPLVLSNLVIFLESWAFVISMLQLDGE